MGNKAQQIVPFILFVVFLILAFVHVLASVGFSVASVMLHSKGEGELSFYWMIAASVTITLVPLFCTLAVKFMVDLLILHGLHMSQKKPDGVVYDIVDDNSDVEGDSETHVTDVKIYKYKIYEVYSDKFNRLSPLAAVCTFLSFTFFVLALIGFLWVILVAYHFHNLRETSAWPYLLTECVACLGCPILAFTGAAFFCVVVSYVTAGQIDPKLAVKEVFPAVVLMEGQSLDTSQKTLRLKYWFIAEHFYMIIRKPFGTKKDLRHAVDCSCSTWLLVAISGLTIMLSVSYFVNQTIMNIVTVHLQDLLEKASLCNDYNCFSGSTYEYINCTQSKNLTDSSYYIHCFKFLRFGIDGHLITTIGVTAGFFLVTIHFFRVVFSTANILMRVLQTRLWGILVSSAGAVIFAASLFILLGSRFQPVNFHIIKVLQLIMIATYCILVGILLCTGTVRRTIRHKNIDPTKHSLLKPSYQDK